MKLRHKILVISALLFSSYANADDIISWLKNVEDSGLAGGCGRAVGGLSGKQIAFINAVKSTNNRVWSTGFERLDNEEYQAHINTAYRMDAEVTIVDETIISGMTCIAITAK